MKKIVSSILSALIAFNSAIAVCASAEDRVSGKNSDTAGGAAVIIEAEMQRYTDDGGSATIKDDYVPDSLVNAARFALTEEEFEYLTANPGSYNLKYIDSQPVVCRDNIVIALDIMNVTNPDPLAAQTVDTGIEVMKRLDAVFFAMNIRNAQLDYLLGVIDGVSEVTTTASTTSVTTTKTTTTANKTTSKNTTTSSGTTTKATTTTSTTSATTTAKPTTTTSTASTTTTAKPTTTTSTASTTTTTKPTTTTSTTSTTITSKATTTTSTTSTTTTAKPTTTTSTTSATTTSKATTTTSTASTTTTAKPTTTTLTTSTAAASTTAVTTTASQPQKYDLGDINGNGIIDAVDASAVLVYYARVSTKQDGGYTDAQKEAADVNSDGQINAVDASCILSFYAYISTSDSKVKTLSEFLKRK